MRTKKKLAAGRWKSLATGGPGYALAVAGRTLPWVLTHRKSPEIEVVNTGGTAYLMGRDGNPVREFAPGEVMFRGRSKVCAAGTVPYYGFGFRMFPYAGSRRGKMQLRLTDLPALKILSHLDSIWAGRFRDEGLFDFLADSVVIRSEEKLPFQVGGDAEGYRDEVSLEVAPSPVDLVDFTAALANERDNVDFAGRVARGHAHQGGLAHSRPREDADPLPFTQGKEAVDRAHPGCQR
jgi:hypothetical protein